MHVGAGAHGEAIEEIVHELGLEIPDHLDGELQLHHGVRAAAQVHRGHRQRFVHRHHEVAGAVDALLVSQRRCHGFAEDDADVFHGVVLVHIQIAGGFQLQVEPAVPGEQLQHVVEEPDAGPHLVLPLAVHDEPALDLGFRGPPVEAGLAGRIHWRRCGCRHGRGCAAAPGPCRGQAHGWLLALVSPAATTASSAAIARSVWLVMPAVTRMQPGL